METGPGGQRSMEMDAGGTLVEGTMSGVLLRAREAGASGNQEWGVGGGR